MKSTQPDPESQLREPALVVRGLSKTFYRRGGQPVRAAQDISFSVPEGRIVGLLGPNGAGKSTTIKCILGLVEPDEGEVEVFGTDAARHRRQALSMMSAVLEGSRNIYWRLTPRENMEFFCSLQGHEPSQHREYIEQLLELLNLSEAASQPVRELSQGMKQKVSIGCALARRTPLLFLDEPTLGLDVETTYQMRTLLRELATRQHRTVVISSHDMKVVQSVCSRVIIIKDGRVVADDRTENLLELFRRRTYTLELSGELPEEADRRLRSEFDNVDIKVLSHRTELSVEAARSEELYRLVDILREAGMAIEGIAGEQPDLEKAFLQIIADKTFCGQSREATK